MVIVVEVVKGVEGLVTVSYAVLHNIQLLYTLSFTTYFNMLLLKFVKAHYFYFCTLEESQKRLPV